MTPDDAPPASLAELIELDVCPRRVWRPQELGAVLLHELSLPLNVALVDLQPGAAEPIAADDTGARLLSLGALLHHAHAPLVLLERVKDASKRARHDPESHLPEDVAAVLYAMAIAAALLRHGRQITSMSAAELAGFLRWAGGRPWLDAGTLELLTGGLRVIGASTASGGLQH